MRRGHEPRVGDLFPRVVAMDRSTAARSPLRRASSASTGRHAKPEHERRKGGQFQVPAWQRTENRARRRFSYPLTCLATENWLGLMEAFPHELSLSMSHPKLGENLKSLRQRHGWTLQQVSSQTGVAVST